MRALLRLALALPLGVLVGCGGRSTASDDHSDSSGGLSQGGASAAGRAGSGNAGQAGVNEGGVATGVDCPSSCPPLECDPGSVRRMLPGDCCPRCFELVCESQLSDYQFIRDVLLEKYASANCSDASDCTVYYESNACAAGCGIPVAASIVGSLESNLLDAAASICSPDCTPPIPPCVQVPAPECIDHRCQ